MLPLVVVVWHDAHFDFDSPDGDPGEEYLVHTTGFLISETERTITICSEVLPRGDGYRAVSHIPQAIVERIERVALGPEAVHAVPDPGTAATGGEAS